jgi:hypothetical protein
MHGYIIPETIQKDLNSVKKYNSKSKIIFLMETDSNAQKDTKQTQQELLMEEQEKI